MIEFLIYDIELFQYQQPVSQSNLNRIHHSQHDY